MNYKNSKSVLKTNLFFASVLCASLVGFVPRQVKADNSMDQAKQMRADFTENLTRAVQMTNQADQLLFARNGARLNTANAGKAQKLYSSSMAIVDDLAKRYNVFLARNPVVFVSGDLIHARNEKGFAIISLINKDVEAVARHWQRAIMICETALAYLRTDSFEGLNVPVMQKQFRNILVDSNLWMAVHHGAMGNWDKRKMHLREALESADDAESIAMIENLLQSPGKP